MSKSRQARRRAVVTLAYEYPDGHSIRPHAHDEHQLIHATTGAMSVSAAGGVWVVPAHRGLWVPAGMTHAIRISGAVSMRTLYFAPELMPARETACLVDISPLLRELILHVVNLGRLDEEVPEHARLLGVIIDQIRLLPGSPLTLVHPKDPRAARLAQALETNPAIDALAPGLLRQIGASRRTVERIFAAQTGMSFGRWRQQLRLIHALRLVAAGGKVTSVALEVGYDSPSAFVQAFRRTFGTTPLRYLRAADENPPANGATARLPPGPSSRPR